MVSVLSTLAQAGAGGAGGSPDLTGVFIWSATMIVAAIIGGAIALTVRRRFLAQDDPDQDLGLSLADIRDMRDRGDLTPQEYEAARLMIIAKVNAPTRPSPDKNAQNP